MGKSARVILGASLLLLTITPVPSITWGMGRDTFWGSVDDAKPRVKELADDILRQLGYAPEQFSAHVFFTGEGPDEHWTVAYWRTPPQYILTTPRDFEVYLNLRGKIKRVVKVEDKKEQLIYGKDERIAKGMTREQVIERLGEPDYKGRPPRWARRDGDDALWRYKINTNRASKIEVYFKEGRVTFFSIETLPI